MVKLKVDFPQISWILLLFACVGYIIAILYNQIDISSKFFMFAFVASCVCIFWGIVFARYIGINDPFWIGMLIVVLASINVLAGSAENRSLDYFGKVLRFDATVMLIYICTRYNIGKSTIRYFSLINQILALTLIYQGVVVGDTYYIYTTLTLGFPNPNSGGIWLALCLCGIIWSYSYTNSKVIRFFYFIEIGLLFYLLIRTGCRSGMLSICGLIAVLISVKKINKKLLNILIKMIYSFPLFFSLVYVGIFNAKIKIDEIAGKKFYSGREVLWYNALMDLKSHYIIGVYNEVSLGTGQSQLHNIYIDVLCSYGIVVFVLFFLYISWIILRQFRKLHTIQQYIAFFSFLMMFFIGGTFEAAYVAGSIGINYWVCTFLLFSNLNTVHPINLNNCKSWKRLLN